jgi:hypothetical protein
MNIARRTLKLSLAASRIMGGMSYAEAYKLVFKKDLGERARELMVAYPDKPSMFCFELSQHGYDWKDLPELAKQ